MQRKLKTPCGYLMEEFVTASAHPFSCEGTIAKNSIHETESGEYTGRFWFEYSDGTVTRTYTKKTAPKWLLAYYEQATT